MSINGGIFIIQQVYNRQVAGIWPKIVPLISPPVTNVSTVNEGDSVIVSVNTFDYQGQTLYWTIEGISGTVNSSDFSAISGSFLVQSNNFGTFTITTIADSTTEGTETFRIQIRTDSISGTIKANTNVITINDTSISQFGWFAGGQNGPLGSQVVLSTVDRTNFASDTNTAISRGPLSVSRSELTGTGNSEYGWFAGGNSTLSTVDRITFVSDTGTASVRGPLSLGRASFGSTSTNDYGWFGGGFPNISLVDRITFVSDTGTATARGPLSIHRRHHSAAGNSNFGWFGGGLWISPTSAVISTVDRITYSSDTNTASVRGPLNAVKRWYSFVSSESFGWVSGGLVGQIPAGPFTNTTTIERINFSSDTVATSIRGPLTIGRPQLTGTDNNTFGWIGGGGISSSTPSGTVLTYYSTIDRITFASDTGTTTVRGPLSLSRQLLDAVSNIT